MGALLGIAGLLAGADAAMVWALAIPTLALTAIGAWLLYFASNIARLRATVGPKVSTSSSPHGSRGKQQRSAPG